MTVVARCSSHQHLCGVCNLIIQELNEKSALELEYLTVFHSLNQRAVRMGLCRARRPSETPSSSPLAPVLTLHLLSGNKSVDPGGIFPQLALHETPRKLLEGCCQKQALRYSQKALWKKTQCKLGFRFQVKGGRFNNTVPHATAESEAGNGAQEGQLWRRGNACWRPSGFLEVQEEGQCISMCAQEFYFLSTSFFLRKGSLISSIILNSHLRNAMACFIEAQGTDLKTANSFFQEKEFVYILQFLHFCKWTFF